MITIVHTRSGDWPAKGWADAYGPRGGRVKDEDYVIGANKPNYPMPAIRRKHTWFVDNNGLCHAVAIGKRWFPRQT